MSEPTVILQFRPAHLHLSQTTHLYLECNTLGLSYLTCAIKSPVYQNVPTFLLSNFSSCCWLLLPHSAWCSLLFYWSNELMWLMQSPPSGVRTLKLLNACAVSSRILYQFVWCRCEPCRCCSSVCLMFLCLAGHPRGLARDSTGCWQAGRIKVWLCSHSAASSWPCTVIPCRCSRPP